MDNNMSKKALIVSPYLDHLGGGERYMLTAGSALESLGYEVYFGWDNLEEILSLSTMLGITLKNPQLDLAVNNLYQTHNPLSMYFSTRRYDLVFYLSDGSLPMLGGKKNLVHMQVPFHGVGGRSWQNRFKQRFIDRVVVNSKFTGGVIDKEYGIASVVLYPPVTPVECRSAKENIILSVGRFEPSLNTKHQDILIEAFKTLSPQLPGWRLVLAGASSSEEWVAKLRSLSVGLPVDFALNVSHKELCELYAKSSVYWHAAGYGVDEQKNPELTEHFGISTVEAISAGCVPLVVPYGGQREIVTDSDFHWTTVPQLIEKTLKMVSNPPSPHFDVDKYSITNFTSVLQSLL